MHVAKSTIVGSIIGLFAALLTATSAHSRELIASAESVIAEPAGRLYLLPDGSQVRSSDLKALLAVQAPRDRDLLVLDLQTGTSRLLRGTEAFDYILANPIFNRFDLTVNVAVRAADSQTFLVNQSRSLINDSGAIIYVGPLNPALHRFIAQGPPSVDFDEDGIDNDDEAALGLSNETDDTDNNGVSDADEDFDGDGSSNIDEINAGSDPADPSSVPDINECANGTVSCGINASCVNTPASFMCECDPGFFGDGQTCAIDQGVDISNRISFLTGGAEHTSRSSSPSISADGGFTAYTVRSADGLDDCFMHTPDGRQVLLNPADVANTTGSDGDCEVPALSRDGRYAAFISNAGNLMPDSAGVPANTQQVYRRDTGSAPGRTLQIQANTVRVSVPAGTSTSTNAIDVSISDNGRYVVFDSDANDLVSGDNNNTRDIFMVDVDSGLTDLISVPTGYNLSGNQPVGGESLAEGSDVSNDGRLVTFVSDAGGLVPEVPVAGVFHVYQRNTLLDTTLLISRNSDGSPANSDSFYPRQSADGRYVTFYSFASNISSADADSDADIYRADTFTDSIALVNVDANGNRIGDAAEEPDISADGRFIAFSAFDIDADNSSIWRKDMQTGTVQLVSYRRRSSAEPASLNLGPATASQASIAGNGNRVAFASAADDIVEDGIDNNSVRDIYVNRSENLHTFVLKDGEWELLRLPLDAQFGSSISPSSAVFSAADMGTYGQHWLLYVWDTTQPPARYRQLGVNESVDLEGKAFWMIQNSGSDIVIELDRFQVASSTGSAVSACDAVATVPNNFNAHCSVTPLADSWLDNPSIIWNAIGRRSSVYGTAGDIRVKTATGNCADGCALEVAVEASITGDVLFEYQSGTGYILQSGDSYLTPWKGYWFVTDTGAGPDLNRELIFPAGVQPAP